jgi:hypothetical protein
MLEVLLEVEAQCRGGSSPRAASTAISTAPTSGSSSTATLRYADLVARCAALNDKVTLRFVTAVCVKLLSCAAAAFSEQRATCMLCVCGGSAWFVALVQERIC